MNKNSALFGGAIAALALVLAVVGLSGNSNPLSNTVYAQNDNFIYQDYSEEGFNELLGKEAFSVFVHSRSCGTCAKKNQEIIDEVNQFSDGTILKLEYDQASQDFLKNHSITKYDTFVNFDASGNFETVKGGQVDDVRNIIQ